MSTYAVTSDSGGYSGLYYDAGSHNGLPYYGIDTFDNAHWLYYNGTQFELGSVLDAGVSAGYKNGVDSTEPEGDYVDVTGTGACYVGLIVPAPSAEHLLHVTTVGGSVPSDLYGPWGVYQGGTRIDYDFSNNYIPDSSGGGGSNGWNIYPVIDPPNASYDPTVLLTVPEGAGGWYTAYWLDFNDYVWKSTTFYVGEDPTAPPPPASGLRVQCVTC